MPKKKLLSSEFTKQNLEESRVCHRVIWSTDTASLVLALTRATTKRQLNNEEKLETGGAIHMAVGIRET